MSYYILRNGQQYGPYSGADIERYLTVGGIVSTDLARTEEMNQWLPLSQIYGNTPPPPTATEDLDTGCGSGQRPAAVSGSREGITNVQPMPPPDHAPADTSAPEAGGHFSDRVRHLLGRLHVGHHGSQGPGQ